MNHTKLVLSLITLSLAASLSAVNAADESAAPSAAKSLPPASAKQGVTFATDIQPLFEASCVKCHSGEKAKGKLRLDTLEGVLAGSEDGEVLVASNSEKSSIVKAVARIHPKTAMPPEPKKPRPGAEAPAKPQDPPKPLTAEEVGLVRAWIDQGAK